jgi:hypothetical protein
MVAVSFISGGVFYHYFISVLPLEIQLSRGILSVGIPLNGLIPPQ